MPSYDWKAAEEFGWVVFTAAGLAAAQIITSTDPATITEPRTYLLAIGGAALRAAAGAIISYAESHQPAPAISADDIRAIVAATVVDELAKQQSLHIVSTSNGG